MGAEICVGRHASFVSNTEAVDDRSIFFTKLFFENMSTKDKLVNVVSRNNDLLIGDQRFQSTLFRTCVHAYLENCDVSE